MPNAGSHALYLLVILFSLIAMPGCKSWSERGAKGVGLLPKASASESKFSDYQPRNPYSELATGILTRTLYETSSGNGYRIEVRDLLVAPQQHSASATLPGSAVCQVLSGDGVLTVGDKHHDLKMGSTFTIPEGEAFAIQNKSDFPFVIRVNLFKAE
jgi:quercetin dioxygenase-like cupin family protein